MKTCNKCRKLLPLDCFYKDTRGGKHGVRSLCKICFDEDAFAYRRSKEGIVTQIYHQQKQSSAHRGHSFPEYSKQELQNWLFSNPLFHSLYERWVKSGYAKELVPSCDRISSLLPYAFSNLQLDTFAQNLKNENEEIMKGIIGRAIPVVGTNRTSGEIVSFVSGSEAHRRLGIHKNHISDCCLGKRKSAGNYTWRHTA